MRTPTIAFTLLLTATLATTRAADKYSIKAGKSEIPKEVKAPLRGELSDTSIQFKDAEGDTLAEVWLRKSISVEAKEDEIKKGLGYTALPQTTFLGVIRFHQLMGDYRDQEPRKGVYSLRLGNQPSDGDHMGTAPFGSFAILTPIADEDGKPTLDFKALLKRSTKASGTGHPCIWLLFPATAKDTAMSPKLKKQFDEHWVIYATIEVTVDGKKRGEMGIGLTLIGKSPEA